MIKKRSWILIASLIFVITGWFFYRQHRNSEFTIENWSYCTQRKPYTVYPYRESCLQDFLVSYPGNGWTYVDLLWVLGPGDDSYYDPQKKEYILEYDILFEFAGDGDMLRDKKLIFVFPSDGRPLRENGSAAKYRYVRDWKRENY